MSLLAAPALSALCTGFLLGASLLVAIGAQNAFVLRQGLRREHVLLVALACSLYDWLLMAAGVGGLGAVVLEHPLIGRWLALAGALFLLLYGLFAWRRALSGEAMRQPDADGPLPWRAVLLQSAAFTFLNPHVYLDTVVLVGSVGAQQAAAAQPLFLAGACMASTLWFFGLAFGARLLIPLFVRPLAWRILDVLIGLIMFLLAALLARDALGGSAGLF